MKMNSYIKCKRRFFLRYHCIQFTRLFYFKIDLKENDDVQNNRFGTVHNGDISFI
jgi:hypothetical protein